MGLSHPTENKPEEDTEDRSEDTIVRPRFDEEAVKQAKPAVPLPEKEKHGWSKFLLIVAIIAGLAGGIIGSVLSMRFFINRQPTASVTDATSTSQNGVQSAITDDARPVAAESAPESQQMEGGKS